MIVARVLLWLCAGLLIYTYFGYPLLAFLLGRGRRLDLHSREEAPLVALVVVARNEGTWIRRRLENALELAYPKERLEIVVYSDASNDGTDRIVGEFDSHGVRLVRGDAQVGQARGQEAAVATTRADIVVFSDANTLFDADALTHLVAPFGDPSVGCVIGSLRYRDPTGRGPTGESAYWRYEEALKASESRLGACVSGTGAIYAVRRIAYRAADPRAPSDFYLPLALAGEKWRIEYEPSARAVEDAPSDAWAELRRHTRTAEGGAFCLLRVPEVRRLLHPFRFPWLAWQLVSHKLIRWLTGLWLGLAILSAAALFRAGPAYLAVASALGLLLTLAVWGAGEAVFRASRTVAVARLAFFFVATSAAMLLGFVRGVAGASRATWQPQR
jgi:cellulose synthase/poly-beta-1,6-N-acetylglucosamine synthase-like glycosyltransferase